MIQLIALICFHFRLCLPLEQSDLSTLLLCKLTKELGNLILCGNLKGETLDQYLPTNGSVEYIIRRKL